MAEHALIIPAQGGLEVWHYEPPHTVQHELEARSEGTYVELTLQRDGQQRATLHVLTGNDAALTNSRAREAVLLLTGVHIALTGNVALTDLSEQNLVEVLGLFG